MTGEDFAWTQTIVTVTPHDDGFIREIDDNTIVSGIADTPLNLDTENIVLRRSLINTTKHFINPAELDGFKRIEVECQTYLQGVPKVQLSPIYRDEATQTIYMRTDENTSAVESYNDIITVTNEKPLPQLRTTRIVQTSIKIEKEESNDFLTEYLKSNTTEANENDDESAIEGTKNCNAEMEATDHLNFVIERILWMKEPKKFQKNEFKSAEIQTSITYNMLTKKININNEVQTNLSCEPKKSNTMLLFEYAKVKNFNRILIEECLEIGVYPRIMIVNIIDKILDECFKQINFPYKNENLIKSSKIFSESRKIIQIKNHICSDRKCSAKCVDKICPTKLNKKKQRIEDILFANSPSYVVKNSSSAEGDSNLKPSCLEHSKIYDSSSKTESSGNSDNSSSSQSIEQLSLVSQRSLTIREEEALRLLKSAFCYRETCNKS